MIGLDLITALVLNAHYRYALVSSKENPLYKYKFSGPFRRVPLRLPLVTSSVVTKSIRLNCFTDEIAIKGHII